MYEIAPGIVLFNNVFSDCMKYIDEIENSDIEWRKAEVLVDSESTGVDTYARDTDMIILNHHLSVDDSPLGKLTKEFHKNLQICLKEYLKEYHLDIETFEKPQLLRYGIGQRFYDHIDDHQLFPRRISVTFYFNDNYEGGEIEFPRFNIRVKANANQLLMFPSNHVYNHTVHPVTNGTRYVLVQWMA